MFELNQLRQFLAVVEHETVSRAADALHITQPALSRSLRHLEYELQAPLFDRDKNKVALTDTGRIAAGLARRVLDAAADMEAQVRDFYRRSHTIVIGSCAPSPALRRVKEAAARLFPDMGIEAVVADEAAVAEGLRGHAYQLGIFAHEYAGDDLVQQPVCSERLYALIPAAHPLARKGGVTFAELDGEDVIPFPLRGHWNDLLEARLPSSRLMYQASVEGFVAVVNATSLISFSSDALPRDAAGHVAVPVLDDEAFLTYRCACLRGNRGQFSALFRELGQGAARC